LRIYRDILYLGIVGKMCMKHSRSSIIPLMSCLAGVLLFVSCKTVEELPGFGEIRTKNQIPKDIVAPAEYSLDTDAGCSWIRESDGFRTGEILLWGPHSPDEIAGFYAIHMQIALWKPLEKPKRREGAFFLSFQKGLDRCLVRIFRKGDAVAVRMTLNPPQDEQVQPR
jgi:hypothetical protein